MNNNTLNEKNPLSPVSDAEIQLELEETSKKYHITGAWIAAILDPLFAITDYINIPDHFLQILFVRLFVAVVSLCMIFGEKKYKFPSFIVIFVPFTLISVQNAYTFFLIENKDIVGHSLNYMALFVGASMFVLWRWVYSVFVIGLSLVISLIFIFANKHLDKELFLLEGGFLLMIVGFLMIMLIKFRYDLTIKEIKARLALKLANIEIEQQKVLVEDKNTKITSSIVYAKKIQNAVLGDIDVIKGYFSDAMVLFKPKDILSGDFYWFHENKQDNVRVVVGADCTGHGVPAALMTVLGHTFLNEIVIHSKIYEASEILKELDSRIIENLNKNTKDDAVNDGMDVCVLVFIDDKILFSAAKNSLYIVANNFNTSVRGSKFPVGSNQYENKVFEQHEIDANKGDKLYIFSDGFHDQFGGGKDTKFLSSRFRQLLTETAIMPMEQQKKILDKTFEDWKGKTKQTDDVLVIGITV